MVQLTVQQYPLDLLNGPFALTGHMVQTHHTGWQKNVEDSNTKEFQPVKLDFPLFSMSQWRMPCFFAIQYVDFVPCDQLVQKAHLSKHNGRFSYLSTQFSQSLDENSSLDGHVQTTSNSGSL